MAITIFKITPALAAVFGTITSFYGLAGLYKNALSGVEIKSAILIICFIFISLISVISFFRAKLFFAKILKAGQLRRVRAQSIICVFFALGCMLGLCGRITAEKLRCPHSGIMFENVSAICGILEDDPRSTGSGDFKNTRGMANLRLRYSVGKHGEKADAKGIVLVFFGDGIVPRLKEFGRGAELYIEGNFLETRDTKMISGELFRARAAHIMTPSSFINQVRTKIRISVIDQFSKGAGGNSWGGLSLALLLGIRDNLDSTLSAQYRNAGCSYILALSGMHLAIVSAIIAFILRRPLGKKKAAILGAVFIIIYVYIVGASPSLVRANIMYLICTLAILFGKSISGVSLLGISFLIQLVMDSRGADSVSFILSYAALGGILILSPMALGLLRGKLPMMILSPLTASFGAFLATMAITSGFFHSLRPVGIVCGLLMVPITTVFMGGSMAYLALSPILPVLTPLGKLFDIVLGTIYIILDKISLIAARLPGIETQNTKLVVIVNITIILLLYGIWKTTMPKKLTLDVF